MGNPLNSFLQGMYAVDRMETNKLNRALAQENQSRVRKLWKREDDEYERLKLERYRGEKLVELDATVQDLMMTLPAGSPLLKDPLAVMQEAHKRMVAKDPSFGEHVALAHGLDPAAGSLVDSKNPVSGFGFAPGKGTFFELLTKTGDKAPYTDNRTSADNDPVTFRQPGLRELVGIYGAGVMKNDVLIAGQMRALLGVDAATGNALPSQDQGQRQTSRARQSVAPDPVAEQERTQVEVDGYVGESEAAITKTKQVNAANDAKRQGVKDAAVAGEYQEAEDKLRRIMTDSNAQTGERLVAGAKKLAIDLFSPGGGEPQRDWVANPPTQEEIDGSLGAMLKASAAYSGEKADAFGGFILDKIHETVYGIDSPTKGQPLTDKANSVLGREVTAAAKPGYPGAKTRDTEATNVGDIRADGNSGSDYTPGKLAQPGEDAGKAMMRTPPPGNATAAAGAARSVAAPVRGKRPNLVQMYNAVGLAKLGLISTEQLQRYAGTGQLNEAAKADLQVLQSGGWARVFDKNTGALSAPIQVAPGDAAGGAPLKAQQASLNYLQDRTKGLFEDRPDRQSEFIAATEGALTILGYPSNSEAGLDARANPDLLNSLVRAGEFTERYDQDTAQNLLEGTGDFNPLPGSDFSIASNNPGALSVAFVADQMGVTSQKAANEFLTQWAGEYAAANKDMSPRELYRNVAQYEKVALNRLRAGRDPDHEDYKKYKGKSRDEIRRELVEELISNR